MIRLGIFLGFLVLGLAINSTSGSPLEGKHLARSKEPIKPGQEITFKKGYRGGEPARVLVHANDPKMTLAVKVEDQDGLVGEASEGSLLGVVWYPTRDRTYKITIRSLGTDPWGFYASFK